MSAKLMKTPTFVNLASFTTLLLAAMATAAFGQGYPASTAPTGNRTERLTQADVDNILLQARAAIKSGKLDDAENLVRRAEAAGIRYPFMHFGPTPSSVRRELTEARKDAPPASRSAVAEQSNSPRLSGGSAARNAIQAPMDDPFLRTAAVNSESAGAPAPALGDRSSSPTSPVYSSSITDAPGGQPAANRLPSPSYTMSDVATPFPGGNIRQTAYGDGPQLNAAERPLDNWTLPSAQSTDRSATPRSAQSAPATAKAEALDRLSAARRALEAGNLELADRFAREASALGVPESQFLPHEDRPSLVAGDIRRAQLTAPAEQGQTGAVRADLSLTAGANRYADQAGPAIYPSSSDSVQRPAQGGSRPSPSSDRRIALAPEPIDLPTESAALPQNLTPPSPSAYDVAQPSASGGEALRLLHEGEAALRRRDAQAAWQAFSDAALLREQLSPADQHRLQSHLQAISSPGESLAAPNPQQAGDRNALSRSAESVHAAAQPRPSMGLTSQAESPIRNTAAQDLDAHTMPAPLPMEAAAQLDSAAARSQALARQLQAEVGRAQSEARQNMESEPQQALDLLKSTRQKVSDSQLPEDARAQLLGRLDRTLEQVQQYIHDNRSDLELDARNKAVLAEVQREREVKAKIRQKIAEMVEEFNRLRDEQRYAEMEVVARRLYEMAPDEPIAQQVWTTAKFIRREIMNRQLADLREESFFKQMDAAERAAINPVAEDGREMVIDEKYWDQFVKGRKGSSDRNARRNERELDIERRLNTPVRLQYDNASLSQVMQDLSQLAGVNIHLDPRGLSQEGVQSNTPVSINLNTEISLKSALNLVLAPLHLSYVIKDEVLQITSEQLRDGELVVKAHPVADLVIPIPNFVPSSNIGLQGLIHDAYAAMGRGPGGIGAPGPGVLVNDRGGIPGVTTSGNVLAQQFGQPASGGFAPTTVPIGSGPGGMGGGANADFDSLIDLIVSTVAPETWAEGGGGTAEVRPFPTNLSLVISQTQAVHQEIADLLEQLRRLQDLQVTIEVRFIRLNDTFFERIGIDFDMNIEDRTIGTADLLPGTPFEGGRQTATVGLTTPLGVADFPRFTNDLDIPFRQNSFELTALPPFGSPADVARFGFAILSDIEAYFLIEAAQGDRRTNVLNAPKVTLFNGQQAFVSDATSMPFVVGVIPVVGEFVAAQQPVIVVLNEGTMLTIQAVVSDDRRYVRLTVVPYFTQIGDVDTFTFEGSSTSTNSSSSTDDDEDGKNEKESEDKEETRTGVTVQLPAFQFVTVVTTVSVPDGGTVLLGGIKRLSEGRNEFGVPLLSKLPYINRLFKNVAIGRETDSLMMMVTPRIIIQEEEEERLGIDVQ